MLLVAREEEAPGSLGGPGVGGRDPVGSWGDMGPGLTLSHCRSYCLTVFQGHQVPSPPLRLCPGPRVPSSA